MLSIIDWKLLGDGERRDVLARPARARDPDFLVGVRRIIDAVRRDGDAALRDFGRRLDGAELDDLAVTETERRKAEATLDAQAIRAIDTAIANVRCFHEAQRPLPVDVETAPGVRCERVTRPIDAVGLYVPAGSAPLPSAAIMLAVPAAIANCPTRILCTPPRRDGSADPSVVTAASRAGVTTIFKVGGAQAIAAMASGTASIPRVSKIFGPGNAWVTAAKSIVSSEPGGPAIDMPAGPSEVLVIADASADAEFVAADLLSQAEHGPDSQVILLSTSRALAEAVQASVARQLERLPRQEIAREALAYSRLILVASLAQAVDVSNDYAPEHLILQCRGARALIRDVRNAGSVFVGEWTPESAGDYCSGTNHVLPTYGYARNYSGLGLDQFLRSMTVQELTRDGLATLAPTIMTLAGLEGLDAHAAAVRVRLESRS